MKIICAKCQCQLKPKTDGVLLIETINGGDPYKLWYADLWACPGCNVEIVAGFGYAPIANHFEADFDKSMAREMERAPQVVFEYERPRPELKR